MSNGDHFSAQGDPLTSDEIRMREWRRKEDEHKKWLEEHLKGVSRTLRTTFNRQVSDYIIKCLKGYHP